MDAAERNAILTRYREHSARFESVAARRDAAVAEVIPFQPLKELEQEPTAREIEVLQLISDGLVNREIGVRLFLSEETVKSHVGICWRSFRRAAEPTPSLLASGVGSSTDRTDGFLQVFHCLWTIT